MLLHLSDGYGIESLILAPGILRGGQTAMETKPTFNVITNCHGWPVEVSITILYSYFTKSTRRSYFKRVSQRLKVKKFIKRSLMEVNRKPIFLLRPVFPVMHLAKPGKWPVAFMTTGNSLICYFSLFVDCWESEMRNRLWRWSPEGEGGKWKRRVGNGRGESVHSEVGVTLESTRHCTQLLPATWRGTGLKYLRAVHRPLGDKL